MQNWNLGLDRLNFFGSYICSLAKKYRKRGIVRSKRKDPNYVPTCNLLEVRDYINLLCLPFLYYFAIYSFNVYFWLFSLVKKVRRLIYHKFFFQSCGEHVLHRFVFRIIISENGSIQM